MNHNHPPGPPAVSRRKFLQVMGVAASTPIVAQLTSHPVSSSLTYVIGLGRVDVADTILTNGKILTVDAADTVAQALAIKDGVILAVGSNDEINLFAGDTTQIYDLAGRVVTPGLIDSHLHVAYLDVMNQMLPFLPPEVATIDAFVAKLEAVAAQTPPGEWIQIYFLALQGEFPTRDYLDPVTPDNPVWVIHQSGHYGYANSKAMEIAGITAATENPPGGIIERDANGELTGAFYNHRAMNFLRQALPPRPEDTTQKSIREGQPLLHACGITSFQDVYVYGIKTVNDYLALGKAGEMTVRAAVYPVLENPREIQDLVALEHYADPFMRLGGFKLQIDGSAMTSYCHAPINGTHYNMPAWPEDIYMQAVQILHDTGLQICVHCVGDAAVDLTLDAFEAAMNANPRPDPRHRIEHCMITTPESTQRIKDLGVVVSNTPTFMITSGDGFVRAYGQERANRIMVAREWIDAGVVMALGSDYPTTPWYNPQRTMAETMARLTFAGNVINPDQRITFAEALHAHTLGSAYASFDENIKGSLEPGKLADLVVWQDDPTTLAAIDLAQIETVAMTFINGVLQHQAG